MPTSRDSRHETTSKKGQKRKFDHLLTPQTPEIRGFQSSPSPEPSPNNWTRFIRAISPSMNTEDQNSDVINGASPEPESVLSSASQVFGSLRSQFPRLSVNAGLLASTAKTKLFRGGIVDDKRYELEQIIRLAASLPSHSNARKVLSRLLIEPLWNDLRHPPLSYLGNEYRYRQADGSNNNITFPRLGAAGSSYAQTVTPQTLVPFVQPDAGLIFDTVFARGQQVRKHPNQISSVFFYLASIITHDIFRTDDTDPNKMKNSSYLDLSPLYGSSDACVAEVRTFKDGKLKPDTFSESRAHVLPPGVAVLLICFNRFHNDVASQLKEINQGGRFDPCPRKSRDNAERQVDEDLFQTARLITCGLYVNIVLHDYVGTILNFNTSDSTWMLDPRIDSEGVFDSHGIPSGIGNQVSVEFNLVYRWHSTISERDARWVEALYSELLGHDDKDNYLTDPARFRAKVFPYFAKLRSQEPERREVRGLTRNNHGKYEDNDLADILTESTKDVAGAFGAKNVPLAMKVIEVMGIEQARKWRVCTLNEFRKFFKLAPHSTFADITTDPKLACTLETLYSKPDYVELYPGLVAEDTKESFEPGSGLCPGFTTSRTILADAVALARGDRFYTVDNSPANLTNWGWNLVRSDPDIAGGGVIRNLLMTALPSQYEGNSVYAMFPFVHPERTRAVLTKRGKEADYDFSTPRFHPPLIPVKSYKDVTRILKNQDDFKVPWGPHIMEITGQDYMLSGDNPCHRAQRDQMDRDLYEPCGWAQQTRHYYDETTRRLIEQGSRELGKDRYQLDIVKDVGNPSHTLFVAQMFHIPLKDSGDLFGVSTKDLYDGLAILFAYVFRASDPAKFFQLRAGAKKASNQLNKLIRRVVKAVVAGKHMHVNGLLDAVSRGEFLSGYGKHMIERLSETGKTTDQIVAEILPTAAAAVATQAQAMVQMLDIYLKEDHSHHWPEIRRCAYSNMEDDFDRLQRYALEACRLAPATPAVLRTSKKGGTIENDKQTVTYTGGDSLYLDFVTAGQDKKEFSNNADQIDIDRSRSPDSYLHHGMGPHACLGRRITQISLAVQLGLFAKLKNLQRTPGAAGELKYTTKLPGGLGSARMYMKEDQSSWWPFPTTMKIQHEGFCDTLEKHEPSTGPKLGRSRVDSGVGLSDGHGLKAKL